MKEARPIYKKLLIAAVAAYVIGNCILQADIYKKLGDLQHKFLEIAYGHKH